MFTCHLKFGTPPPSLQTNSCKNNPPEIARLSLPKKIPHLFPKQCANTKGSYVQRKGSEMQRRPKATVSHLAKPDVQKTGTRMATSMRMAPGRERDLMRFPPRRPFRQKRRQLRGWRRRCAHPRRERDSQHRELQIPRVWPHTASQSNHRLKT